MDRPARGRAGGRAGHPQAEALTVVTRLWRIIHADTQQQHQRRVKIHVVSVTSRRQSPDGRSSPHKDGLNVNDCLLFFNCSVADAIYRRKTKFLSKLQHTDNTLLTMFYSNMAAEIAKLPL